MNGAHTFYLRPLAERRLSHSSEKMEMKALKGKRRQGLTREVKINKYIKPKK